jgi:hypothetical protein
MLPIRHRGLARGPVACLAIACLVTACATQLPSLTPSTSVEESALVSPSPTPSPTLTPAPTPSPTPDQAGVPLFAPGVEVATAASGVRVRGLPGTQWSVVATLRDGAKLQVVLGPVRTAGYGWYLVTDADPAPPTFREGWVAAGYAPNAFLASANEEPAPSPGAVTYVAGWAALADGRFGPVHLEGTTYALRWAAALPPGTLSGATCTFRASLDPGGQAITFATTTVAQTPVPGIVQSSFFVSHPSLQGDLFLRVTSSCSWAVTVVRLPAI